MPRSCNDRSRPYPGRLFEAKKRYNLEVLNFTITSNHVHLLVFRGEDHEAITTVAVGDLDPNPVFRVRGAFLHLS